MHSLSALCAVARAAWRVGWHGGKPLPDLVSRLKDVPRSSADPRLTLRLVERLLPLLPPYGAGRCVKRSLLLLDLWSRAGLAPRLHLGVFSSSAARAAGESPSDGERGGHAWVTTSSGTLATYRPPDVLEAWTA
jgi:hypothetical protein